MELIKRLLRPLIVFLQTVISGPASPSQSSSQASTSDYQADKLKRTNLAVDDLVTVTEVIDSTSGALVDADAPVGSDAPVDADASGDAVDSQSTPPGDMNSKDMNSSETEESGSSVEKEMEMASESAPNETTESELGQLEQPEEPQEPAIVSIDEQAAAPMIAESVAAVSMADTRQQDNTEALDVHGSTAEDDGELGNPWAEVAGQNDSSLNGQSEAGSETEDTDSPPADDQSETYGATEDISSHLTDEQSEADSESEDINSPSADEQSKADSETEDTSNQSTDEQSANEQSEIDSDSAASEESADTGEPPQPLRLLQIDDQPVTLLTLVESLLFVAETAAEPKQFAEVLDVPIQDVEAALQQLTDDYVARGSGLRVQERGGKFTLVSMPLAAQAIEDFLNLDLNSRLSSAALETLAIVAYRQPVTRIQVESVRGVDCGGVLRTLLQRELVAEVGRLEAAGRPILYGVTDLFMQHFGLTTMDELPSLETTDADILWAATQLADEEEEADDASNKESTETGDGVTPANVNEDVVKDRADSSTPDSAAASSENLVGHAVSNAAALDKDV